MTRCGNGDRAGERVRTRGGGREAVGCPEPRSGIAARLRSPLLPGMILQPRTDALFPGR